MDIVPEKKYHKIGGKEFWVKKFSIKQGLRFGRWLIKVVTTGSDGLKKISKNLEKSKSNVNDIMMMFDVLDEKDIYEFIAICLNTEDIDFVEENVAVEQFIEIVSDVFELNDIGSILKNSLRTAEIVGKQLKNIEKEIKKQKN